MEFRWSNIVEPDVKNNTNEKQSVLTLKWILRWT